MTQQFKGELSGFSARAETAGGKRKVQLQASTRNLDGSPVRSKTCNARMIYPVGDELRTKSETAHVRDGAITATFDMASTDPGGEYLVEVSKTGCQALRIAVQVPDPS